MPVTSPKRVGELTSALVEEWSTVALVETPHTDCYFWYQLFVQGHIVPVLFVECLWNFFSLRLSCWIFLCSYKCYGKSTNTEAHFFFI